MSIGRRATAPGLAFAPKLAVIHAIFSSTLIPHERRTIRTPIFVAYLTH